MGHLVLDQIKKRYGKSEVLHSTSLAVNQGELVAVLGPSGCGKSTLLGLVSGLLTPTAGSIFLDERCLNLVPAEERGIPMIFQDHLLFPNMTAEENVAFGLRVRRLPQKERQDRVAAVLASVQLGHLGGRFPAELSGGQRQRVALARALVLQPAILLLDEPFSSLDTSLRREMRDLVMKAKAAAGFSALLVTHDPEEALAMADRIAIMRAGSLVQVGTPVEVYERPKTAFVATFLGAANIIPTVDGLVCVRPEALKLATNGEGLAVRVSRRYFAGSRVELVLQANFGDLLWYGPPDAPAAKWPVGSSGVVSWLPQRGVQVEDS